MTFADDLPALYADFGETVTIAGASAVAIFNGGYAEAEDVAGTNPSLRCKASDVSGTAIGATVVRAGVTYTVRGKQPIPPDEVETVLILERA